MIQDFQLCAAARAINETKTKKRTKTKTKVYCMHVSSKWLNYKKKYNNNTWMMNEWMNIPCIQLCCGPHALQLFHAKVLELLKTLAKFMKLFLFFFVFCLLGFCFYSYGWKLGFVKNSVTPTSDFIMRQN